MDVTVIIVVIEYICSIGS